MRRTRAKVVPISVLLLAGLLLKSSCARSGLAIHADSGQSPPDAVFSDDVVTSPLPDVMLSDAAPLSPTDALAISADTATYQEDSGAGAATVAIEPGLASYSSIMSSVPGLPLEAVAGGAAPTNPLYRWRADYGAFRLWRNSKVTEHGNDFIVGETTLYWGYYIPGDISVPVLIRVDLLGDNDQPLASNTLTLSWTAQGGVTVN